MLLWNKLVLLFFMSYSPQNRMCVLLENV